MHREHNLCQHRRHHRIIERLQGFAILLGYASPAFPSFSTHGHGSSAGSDHHALEWRTYLMFRAVPTSAATRSLKHNQVTLLRDEITAEENSCAVFYDPPWFRSRTLLALS